MRVAIFSPYATVVPHFETELDIAQQHLDAGDQVEFFNCMGQLSNCDFNSDKSAERCADCVGRRTMGLESLSSRLVCHTFDEFDQVESFDDQTWHVETVEQLSQLTVDNFDIGYAVLSSLVSIVRDPEPDLEKHRPLLKRFLESALQTYLQTIDYLSNNQIDRVYVFNGRFAAMRAVLRACQQRGIDCFLHERGCNEHHYILFENHLPHDLEKIEAAILETWNAAEENPDRDEIAASWFLDRVNRVERVWHSFTKNQERDRLPESFDPSRKNIAIFNSSDDEFVAIGDAWRNRIYPNQVDAIRQIANDMLQAQPNTRLYLRVHPNLTQVENARKQQLLQLEFSNLEIIAPDAEIDTYALIRSSDTVVSFGSSVGSEAVYWNRPSVLLGPCFYQNLGGVYKVNSHADTIRLLSADLTPLEKTGMLKYGFWFQTRGVPHRYFQATGLFEGTFKGETLYSRPKLSRFKTMRRQAKQTLRKLIGK